MDKKKVIDGLNDIGCFIAGRVGIEQARNFLRTIDDAIALLKEQEKPNGKCVNECECWDSAYERGKQDTLKEQEAKHVNISQTHCGMTYGLCPQCEKRIDTLVNPNYCGFCGQELKWK